MAKVTFFNPFEQQTDVVEVPAGTTLLEAARQAGTRMGSNCGGVCACSTCHCYVKQGGEALSAQEEREEDRLSQGFDVKLSSRLGCQSLIEKGGAELRVELTQESLQAFYDEHPDERRFREQRSQAGRPHAP
jgi:ferredoxin, 2Fe-2S